jgi:hypothetical protein
MFGLESESKKLVIVLSASAPRARIWEHTGRTDGERKQTGLLAREPGSTVELTVRNTLLLLLLLLLPPPAGYKAHHRCSAFRQELVDGI